MGITWGPSGLDYIVGSDAGDSGKPLYITDDEWGSGDTIRIATFRMEGGEGIVSYKAVIQSVEYDVLLVALGSSIWRMDFRYADYPAWEGYPEGTDVTVDAKVVGDGPNTHLASDFYGASSFLMCSKTSTPDPADDADPVPLDTDELTFDCANFDEGATPFQGRLWKDGTPQGFSSNFAGKTYDISSHSPLTEDSVYTWRIDTNIDTASDIVGDTWTFTARDVSLPDKATNPNPANTATGVTLDQPTLTWTEGTGADYERVYFGPSGNMSLVDANDTDQSFSLTGYLPFPYNTTYQWRIDSVNDAGTTTGDTWSFTTLVFGPPSGGSGPGSGDFQLIKRLCACADDKFWYESV